MASLAEAAIGLTEEQINSYLAERNKNPDNYDIYPFYEIDNGFGVLKNKHTGKIISCHKIRESLK